MQFIYVAQSNTAIGLRIDGLIFFIGLLFVCASIAVAQEASSKAVPNGEGLRQLAQLKKLNHYRLKPVGLIK
jgi:hypothetical protein